MSVDSVRPLDPAGLLQLAMDDVRRRPLSHLSAQVGFLVPIGTSLALGLMVLLVALFTVLAAEVILAGGGLGLDAWLHLHGSFARPWAQICDVGGRLTLNLVCLGVSSVVLVLYSTLRLGLHRGLAREAAGEPAMGFATSFRRPFWRLGTLALVALTSPFLVVAASVPLLSTPIAFHAPTMAIFDVGTVEAARLQLAALARNPARFLALACLSTLLTGFARLVPIAGPAIALAFQHHAARDVLAAPSSPTIPAEPTSC